MATFSPKYLTARWREREQKLRTAIIAAERDSAEAMRKTAIRLSGGPYKTAWLKQQAMQRDSKRGLYSTADPAPPAPAFIINTQSAGWDALRNHWQTRITYTAGEYRSVLWNSSGHAKFMLGTRKMIARPILQQVVQLEKDARLQRLRRAKLRALK